ncbi:ribosome-binding factor A family protein [Striga asiatica]|uniref:Ribosome-binding factor A family protein n=1 Tax=Striga asiatica TaxID=4170 RepID=A0A5A7QY16_STRAF|nr:ribosome-binding factor A family protein [Striga asiatica]
MPHTLNHCSTIALSCFTAHSARPFCTISSVGLCRRQPHRVVTSTIFGGGITNGPNGTIRSVICMANPRRVQMVSRQIRREISDMLLKDKVLQRAVLPESALGADRYLSSVTTVSDVEVSADLQVIISVEAECTGDVLGVLDLIDISFWFNCCFKSKEVLCVILMCKLMVDWIVNSAIPTENKKQKLQVVKVYVSVFGDERGKEVAIAGLKSKAKYVRSQLGKRMKLRLTPEVRFIEDESIERGSRMSYPIFGYDAVAVVLNFSKEACWLECVLAILDRLKEEREREAAEDGDHESDGGYDDEEWQDDDMDDEGIIYVD